MPTQPTDWTRTTSSRLQESGNSGVFDFDRTPFFVDAWNASHDYFKAAVKYHIADHRPLWAEFDS